MGNADQVCIPLRVGQLAKERFLIKKTANLSVDGPFTSLGVGVGKKV